MRKKTITHTITPSPLFAEAERRYKELTGIKKNMEKSLSAAPAGKIHLVKKQNHMEFYLRRDKQEKSGVYMTKTDPAIIRNYTQKSYDEKVIRLLDKEISALEKYLKSTDEVADRIRRVYSDNHPEVKNYIEPIDISDEDFIIMWMAQPYVGKEIPEDAVVFETDRGERVRSKSELTIANAMAKRGIPYKYECPLILKSGQRIHPDFTVLNVKKRQQIFWEHRGMMDDPEYAKHAVERVKQYTKSGLIIGRNLVITEEAARSPLGTDEIESIIKTFFL